MIKKKNLVITAVAAALTLTACGQKKEEEPAIPSVLDDGVLVVGLVDTEDRSCFRIVDENGDPFYAGWEPEILQLLDESMEEATLDYRYAKDQAELISWLNTGEVELAAGSFTRLEGYNGQYLISDDYGYGSLYVVNGKNAYLDTLAAFTDCAVGVSSRIPASSLAEMTGVENVVQNPYADMSQLARDISGGVVSAGVVTEDEMLYILSTTELKAAEMRSTPQVGLVFLSGVGQEYLMSWVNYAIDLHFYYEAVGPQDEEE